jgi:hypothetical protein
MYLLLWFDREYKQYSALSVVVPLHQMLLCLRGHVEHSTSISETETYLRELPLSNELKLNGFESNKSYCMQLYLFVGDIGAATRCYEEIKDRQLGLVEASILYQSRLFYFALICFANYRKIDNTSFKSSAKVYMEIIQHLVVSGGAMNLAHKYLLLEAESAATNSTHKGSDSILKSYEQAVVAAARAGYLQDGALASMFCALYCMDELKRHDDAKFHMGRARDMFASWGAKTVANRLSERYPQYFSDADDSTIPITPGSLKRASTSSGSSSARSQSHFRSDVILKHKGGNIDGVYLSPKPSIGRPDT